MHQRVGQFATRMWARVKEGTPSKTGLVVTAVTVLGFPLIVLGTWAAIAAVRMASWTRLKDSLEWCENVSLSIVFVLCASTFLVHVSFYG